MAVVLFKVECAVGLLSLVDRMRHFAERSVVTDNFSDRKEEELSVLVCQKEGLPRNLFLHHQNRLKRNP